jgi:hypothetical protein
VNLTRILEFTPFPNLMASERRSFARSAR